MAEPVFSEVIPELLTSHFNHLKDGSGISVDVIRERGYRSLLGKSELVKAGFTSSQQRTPGIFIPLWGVDGKEVGCQYRPDNPRIDTRERPVKYETPRGSSNRLDCPPRCQKLLGDPQVPLWVTEGCKKADALASHGACAISLTGVWGFKGKNEFGGITFLADWDYIALRGRKVYLAFDSDIVSKEPVKKALEHVGELLRRKEAKVQVIHLPQAGIQKVGIDDFLLEHPLGDAEKLAADLKPEENEDREQFVSGFVLNDGTIGEMVVDDDGQRSFIVSVNGSVRRMFQLQTPKATYIPTSDRLVGEVVHFASSAVPYDSQSALFKEVMQFIHRYLELPADFEDITTLYVLLTWVYEFAPSVPYLRVLGDWGTGKTRFLQVVGAICFRPIFASGATTPAPIFRILEEFRGTLVLDEADFKDSSSWVEMVKLLNNGYRPGMPVLRADKENGKWFPRSYQVFGPKLIATRYPFRDEALESRCLTAEMMPLTRSDIPRVLPPSFDTEVKELRARLLTFRLVNLLRLKGKTFGNDLVEPNLQPRLQEILIPLKAMLNGDQTMAEAIAGFVHRLQESLFTRRRDSSAGKVMAAIIDLHAEGVELTSQNIADRINQTEEEVKDLSADKIGRITKRLGFIKDRVGKVRQRIIRWDEERVKKLASLYGLQLKPSLSPPEVSEVSFVSALDSEAADTIDANKEKCPPECPLSDESEATLTADGADTADTIFDKGNQEMTLPGLGMTVEQALRIWAAEGQPVVHLGPGENCFDLERLLSNRYINERHIAAINAWLKERRSKYEENPL
jgi:hypothetical protein